MPAEPARPIAADLDRCSPHVACVDEEIDGVSLCEPIVQSEHGRLAKLTDIASRNPKNDHATREFPNGQIAMHAVVADLLVLQLSLVAHGKPSVRVNPLD